MRCSPKRLAILGRSPSLLRVQRNKYPRLGGYGTQSRLGPPHIPSLALTFQHTIKLRCGSPTVSVALGRGRGWGSHRPDARPSLPHCPEHGQVRAGTGRSGEACLEEGLGSRRVSTGPDAPPQSLGYRPGNPKLGKCPWVKPTGDPWVES